MGGTNHRPDPNSRGRNPISRASTRPKALQSPAARKRRARRAGCPVGRVRPIFARSSTYCAPKPGGSSLRVLRSPAALHQLIERKIARQASARVPKPAVLDALASHSPRTTRPLRCPAHPSLANLRAQWRQLHPGSRLAQQALSLPRGDRDTRGCLAHRCTGSAWSVGVGGQAGRCWLRADSSFRGREGRGRRSR